jgi:hypothetical protein
MADPVALRSAMGARQIWAIAGLLGLISSAVHADPGPPGATPPIARPCACNGVYVEPSAWVGVDITADNAPSIGLAVGVGYFHDVCRIDGEISAQLRVGAFAQVGSVYTQPETDTDSLGGELEVNWILPGSQFRIGPRVAVAEGTNAGQLFVAGVRFRRHALSLGFDVYGATAGNGEYEGETLVAGHGRAGASVHVGYDVNPTLAAIGVGASVGAILLMVGLLSLTGVGSR